VPLAPFTTFRIGGVADYLFEARSASELAEAVVMARAAGLPTTLLGGGSNVLVADTGIRGLVLRVRGGLIGPEGAAAVRADAGVSVNSLVRWAVGHGYVGLEVWAGTPGTVGGAVFGNAHFREVPIADLVESVRLLTPDNRIVDAGGGQLSFAYDYSRLQDTGEIALSALFALRPGGDPATLRGAARASLAYRRRTQPLETFNAGCVFRNPDPRVETLPPGIPPSAGALVDRAGLKGYRVGGASVSALHANFIVNDGSATAGDVRALARLCRERVRDLFGVVLREEIRYLGDFGTCDDRAPAR
jgi:UDP-N-acetylmuramate dehydrogenase